MSFTSSQKARLLLLTTELTPKLSSARGALANEMLETTSLDDDAKRFIVGLGSGDMTVEGFLDLDAINASFGQLDLLEGLLGAAGVVTYAPTGLALGSPVILASGRMASFEEGTEVGGVANFSLALTGDGHVAPGNSLHDLTAETIDGNGSAFDRGVASSAGAVAHLHCTAFSGLTNNIVTIEDSANGSSGWATIGTFTTITAATYQRLEITGAVRQYLRAVWNVTGTGSCTFQVSVAPL